MRRIPSSKGGLTPPVEVYDTGTMGFGLRGRVAIHKGQKIGEYRGEVVDQNELLERRCKRKAEDPFYIAALGDGLSIDAGNRGGYARFANHSSAGGVPWCLRVDGVASDGVAAIASMAPRRCRLSAKARADSVDGVERVYNTQVRPELQAREVEGGRGAPISPRGSTGHPAAGRIPCYDYNAGAPRPTRPSARVQVRASELHWGHRVEEERCEE